MAAVTAARTAAGDVLFAPECEAPTTAVACRDVNIYFVDKHQIIWSSGQCASGRLNRATPARMRPQCAAGQWQNAPDETMTRSGQFCSTGRTLIRRPLAP